MNAKLISLAYNKLMTYRIEEMPEKMEIPVQNPWRVMDANQPSPEAYFQQCSVTFVKGKVNDGCGNIIPVWNVSEVNFNNKT